MRNRFGIIFLTLVALAAVLFVVPSAKGATMGVDLGTVVYATNVNAAIFDTSNPSGISVYTYNQILQGPDAATLGITLDNGNTVAQELSAQGYTENTGILQYNFAIPGGASGSYSQNGTPSFPPPSDIGPGLPVSMTSTTVSGTVCNGANSVGSTINPNPIYSAATIEAILGCEALGIPNEGFPTSSTSTAPISLGTITNGNTVEYITGEETVTNWVSSGIIHSQPSSATPEPASLWLAMAGAAAVFAISRRRRPANERP